MDNGAAEAGEGGVRRNLCAEASKTSLTVVKGMHQYSKNILEIVQRWGVRERWGGGGLQALKVALMCT